MKLSKILEKAKSTEMQFLDETVVGIKQKRAHCEVSFLTDGMTPNDLIFPSKKVGIVVFIDRVEFNDIVKADKSKA